MKLSQSSIALLEGAIKKAVAGYANGGEQNIVTDLYLQPNPITGEVLLLDDDDHELSAIRIPEWGEYPDADFYPTTEQTFASLLSQMKQAGSFSGLSLMMPYSFVLVDDDKETLAELLLVDDDTLLLSDELLKGLDEELDDFLKQLLEE